VTDFGSPPESPVTFPESAVTFDRDEAEFVLELALIWLSCPISHREPYASEAECHAQNQRCPAPQI
jgi:hypothetical protein